MLWIPSFLDLWRRAFVEIIWFVLHAVRTPLHPLTSLHTSPPSHFPPHLSTLSLPFAIIHLSVKLPQLFVNIETNQTDLRFLKQKLTDFLKYVSEFDLD
jgi:hypothetical protein